MKLLFCARCWAYSSDPYKFITRHGAQNWYKASQVPRHLPTDMIYDDWWLYSSALDFFLGSWEECQVKGLRLQRHQSPALPPIPAPLPLPFWNHASLRTGLPTGQAWSFPGIFAFARPSARSAHPPAVWMADSKPHHPFSLGFCSNATASERPSLSSP